MSDKVHIDADVAKILYYRYKDFIFPAVGFALSLIIFLQVVIPQVQNFLTVKQEVAVSEETLAVLTQNYNTISLLNDKELQKNLNSANQALPNVKDFAGILNAISSAASLGGVAVNDYSFQIGDIDINADTKIQDYQKIQVALTIQGDIGQIKQFLTALSNQLPLSEVTGVSITSNSSAVISANFFYSPLPKVAFVDTTSLPMLSAQQKKILQTFSTNAAVTPPPTPKITAIPTIITPIPQPTSAQVSSASAH